MLLYVPFDCQAMGLKIACAEERGIQCGVAKEEIKFKSRSFAFFGELLLVSMITTSV